MAMLKVLEDVRVFKSLIFHKKKGKLASSVKFQAI